MGQPERPIRPSRQVSPAGQAQLSHALSRFSQRRRSVGGSLPCAAAPPPSSFAPASESDLTCCRGGAVAAAGVCSTAWRGGPAAARAQRVSGPFPSPLSSQFSEFHSMVISFQSSIRDGHARQKNPNRRTKKSTASDQQQDMALMVCNKSVLCISDGQNRSTSHMICFFRPLYSSRKILRQVMVLLLH